MGIITNNTDDDNNDDEKSNFIMQKNSSKHNATLNTITYSERKIETKINEEK